MSYPSMARGAPAASYLFLLVAVVTCWPSLGNAAIVSMTGMPPSTISVGRYYLFSPTVVLVGEQGHQFLIENLPYWASFDPYWGRLTGVPGPADVGQYPGIKISLRTDTEVVELPAFSVVVQSLQAPADAAAPAKKTSATIRWQAPSLNTDGTRITNLAGYQIYLGRSAETLSKYYDMNDPAARLAIVRKLPAGRLYFAVKAYTHDGVESALSNIVSVVLE